MFKKLYQYIFFALCLGFLWLSLSGFFDKFLLICGFCAILLSCFILNYLFILPKINFSIKGIRYTIRVFYDICFSSAKLIKIIFDEHINIESKIGIVNFNNLNNIVDTVMQANAITATPGTIVIGIHANQMLVHFFDKNDYSETPSESICKIIGNK